MKILLIEDTTKTRNELLQSLTEFSPEAVDNAEDALNILKTKDFDVIFSDVNLPGLDGFAFAKELRKTDTKTPILIYTSQFDPPEEYEWLATRHKAKFIRSNPIKRIYEAALERLKEAIEENQIITAK